MQNCLSLEIMFNLLNLVSPEIGTQLSSCLDYPVEKYLSSFYKVTPLPISKFTINAREHLLKFLYDLAITQGNCIDIELALEEFNQHPVLHTGGHCQLLLDPKTFAAAFAAYMSSLLNNRQYIFFYQCSTVTLEGSKREGPAWLTAKGKQVNMLIDVPRHQLAKRSVCALSGPISLSISPNGIVIPGTELYQNALYGLEGFESLPDLFFTANKKLWSHWQTSEEIKLFTFDDLALSDLLVSHLLDCNSLISMLIFNEDLQKRFQDAWKKSSLTPKGMFLQHNLCSFWGLRDGRIRRLEKVGNHLVEIGNEEKLSIPWKCDSIVKALKEREIVPDLFLVFLMIGILPRVKVLGGARQLGYIPEFQKILSNTLDHNHIEQQSTLEELKNATLHGLSFGIFQDICPIELSTTYETQTFLKDLVFSFQSRSLREVSQSLKALRYSPKWQQFYSRHSAH
jgi:hypothetical protein